MDKYEYKLKLEQLKNLVAEKDYSTAAEIADTINWRKVKSAATLCMVGEIYDRNKQYENSREILLMAYDRATVGRNIIYRLALVSMKMGNLEEAKEYYEEFLEVAPYDNLKYVLRYQLARLEGLPIEELIAILEEFKEREYTEEWAFELACLYHRSGNSERCVEVCDELVLWIGEGKYVERALELKMLYQPLNKYQEEKYREIKMRRGEIFEAQPEDTIESEEIIHETVEIPDITANTSRFNTLNLQEELAKGMQQIMEASTRETVSDTMDNIKKIVEEIPYLQMPQQEDEIGVEAEEERYGHIETDEEIDGSLQTDFKELLAEDWDDQIRMDAPGREWWEEQNSGQPRIEDVLSEWEKTRRAAEVAMAVAQQRKLESAKARALQEAEELMERLNQIIPKLNAGVSPQELLAERYLQDAEFLPEEEYYDEAEPELPPEGYVQGAEPGMIPEGYYQPEAGMPPETEPGQSPEGYVQGAEPRMIPEGYYQPEAGMPLETESGLSPEGYVQGADPRMIPEGYYQPEVGHPSGSYQPEGYEQGAEPGAGLPPESYLPEDYIPEPEAGPPPEDYFNAVGSGMAQPGQQAFAENMQDPSGVLSEEAEVSFEEPAQEQEYLPEDFLEEGYPPESALARAGYPVRNFAQKQRLPQESLAGAAEVLPENAVKAAEILSESAGKAAEILPENAIKGPGHLPEISAKEKVMPEVGSVSGAANYQKVLPQVPNFPENSEEAGIQQGFLKPQKTLQNLPRQQEAPAGMPVQEAPAGMPVQEELAGMQEEPVRAPVQEAPTRAPALRASAGMPVQEELAGIQKEPVRAPVQEVPARAPAPKASAGIPVQEELAGMQEAPVRAPAPEASAGIPVQEELAGMQEAPARAPAPRASTGMPVQEVPAGMPLQPEIPKEPETPPRKDAESYLESAFRAAKASREEKNQLPKVELERKEEQIPEPEPIPREFPIPEVTLEPEETLFVSEIGIAPEEEPVRKLSEEQREIFSYFVPVTGMEQQLCQVLEGALHRKGKDSSSGSGNILIMGGRGSGKTVLATDIIKAVQKSGSHPEGKVGKITGESLNQKDLSQLIKKIAGGYLIIERAGEISQETATRLALLMDQDTDGLLFILEDTRKGIEKALSQDANFAKKFTERIKIPVFTSDELVEFAKAYAFEQECEIDDMGILALYNRISNIQKLDEATTLTEVKEIVDMAISSAERGGFKKLFGGKKFSPEGYLYLREKDFEE